MRLVLLFAVLSVSFAQLTPRSRGPKPAQEDAELPTAELQRELLRKQDYKKNMEDAAALAKIAEELKSGVENRDRNIVSAKMIKQTEEIEKLARSIRGRLKRY